MNYEIEVTDQFERDIKYYKRKKKFTNIQEDINDIVVELEKGHLLGDEITNIKLPERESSYKVRVANSNTKVGKSNGYRLIYYVIKDDQKIFLLTVYYKKDKENIASKEIENLINAYCV